MWAFLIQTLLAPTIISYSPRIRLHTLKLICGFMLKNKAPLPSKEYLHGQRSKLRERQEGKKSISVGRRSPQAHDHIIAERMRREKITQQFIALSALIPGLKKVDKATVLEEAIKYVKQLQEHVKMLEEQSKKKSVESVPVVFVKKSHLSVEEHVSDVIELPNNANQLRISKKKNQRTYLMV